MQRGFELISNGSLQSHTIFSFVNVTILAYHTSPHFKFSLPFPVTSTAPVLSSPPGLSFFSFLPLPHRSSCPSAPTLNCNLPSIQMISPSTNHVPPAFEGHPPPMTSASSKTPGRTRSRKTMLPKIQQTTLTVRPSHLRTAESL